MPRRYETRRELRDRQQRERACSQSAARVTTSLEQMHAAHSATIAADAAVRRCRHRRLRTLARHRDVVRGGIELTVRSVGVLVFLAAILVVDVLLAGGTVDFLLKQSEDIRAWGHVLLLKFVVLAAIIAIELTLALMISHARDQNARRAVAGLATASALIVVSMAFMSYILAGANTENIELTGAAAGLPWVAASLTLAFHALAIYHGDAVSDALSCLILWIQLGYIALVRRRFERSMQRNSNAIGRCYRASVRQIEHHNRCYAAAPVRFCPIEANLERILRVVFSDEEVERARRLGLPTEPPQTETRPPEPQQHPPHPAPEPAQPPPERATADADAAQARPTAAAADDAVDMAYSTLVSEEEARTADSEVRP